jgi:hypothetical protein
MAEQLSLFGPSPAAVVARREVVLHRSQPHARLDHAGIDTDHAAWIGHGDQVFVERRQEGEGVEAWADRAWELVVRWGVARAYRAGVCVWDSRDETWKEVCGD